MSKKVALFMDFKLDYGPWETVFMGQAYGHEVEIVSNPEHFFIVFIFDKKDGRKLGAVVEGYKAYYAKGQMEAFIQTLPKPTFGVEKTMGEKANKIFFLSFGPFYLDFRQDDFVRKIDIEIRKTEENALTIIDLARASSLDLKDLSTVPKADYAPVLGDPFMIKMLISGQRPADLTKMDIPLQASTESEEPQIQLGLGKMREIIREKIDNLKRTQIIGQSSSLHYAMYILCENILLENIPVILFDSTDYFDGLGSSAVDAISLKDEMVEFEPMGFPVKNYTAKESIKVSLKNADIFFMLDMLGLQDPEFQKNLSLFAFTMQSNTPEELAEKVIETKELSDFDKLRAERILRIVEMEYKGLFGEEFPSSELTKTIPGKLGRAVVLDTRTLSKEEKILFMHTLIRQLTKNAAQTGPSNYMVMLPEAQLMFSQSVEKTSTAISRMMNRGIGIIFGIEKDVNEELSGSVSAKINIVSGKDVAVSIKGKRNYRVILRPSLSGNPKA
jgi:hypothetical protein